jgi:hypothetical protein
MSRSIFISHVHEDIQYIGTIEGWAQNRMLGDLVITVEAEDKRSFGYEVIRGYIEDKIRNASYVLVLVGKDTHNHNWVRAEVELANSFQKKIICMRIPGTTSPPPPILSNYTAINFDVASLKKALDFE